jgi:hypothetical protein
MCIRRETREKARRSLAFSPVSKPRTHITYMLRQCTRIVYIRQSRYPVYIMSALLYHKLNDTHSLYRNVMLLRSKKTIVFDFVLKLTFLGPLYLMGILWLQLNLHWSEWLGDCWSKSTEQMFSATSWREQVHVLWRWCYLFCTRRTHRSGYFSVTFVAYWNKSTDNVFVPLGHIITSQSQPVYARSNLFQIKGYAIRSILRPHQLGQ